jgi:integrase
MSSLVKPKKFWELYYHCLPGCAKHPQGNVRHHESLGIKDKKAAKDIQKEFDGEQAKTKARIKLGLSFVQPDPNLTIRDMADKYFEGVRPEKSPYTISNADEPAIKHLIKTVGNIPVRLLDEEAVRRYRTHFLDKDKLSPASWNSRRKVLRAIWNWGIRAKLLDANPFIQVGDVVDHEDDHRLQPVPKSRLRDILAACPDRAWQLVILFFYQSMCRKGELIRLRRDDVLRSEGLIRFRRPKERSNREVKHKYLTITPELLAIIDEAESQCNSEHVFSRLEREGRPLYYSKVTKMLNTIGKRIGSPLSPHRLRKSGATDSSAAGTDIRTIQTLLGHADIRTTAKYIRPNQEHQRAAMQRLGVDQLLTVPNDAFTKLATESLKKAHHARRASAAPKRSGKRQRVKARN